MSSESSVFNLFHDLTLHRTDIDECNAETIDVYCLNGTCVNLVGSYVCKCDRGYHGDTCSETLQLDQNQAGFSAVVLFLLPDAANPFVYVM